MLHLVLTNIGFLITGFTSAVVGGLVFEHNKCPRCGAYFRMKALSRNLYTCTKCFHKASKESRFFNRFRKGRL